MVIYGDITYLIGWFTPREPSLGTNKAAEAQLLPGQTPWRWSASSPGNLPHSTKPRLNATGVNSCHMRSLKPLVIQKGNYIEPTYNAQECLSWSSLCADERPLFEAFLLAADKQVLQGRNDTPMVILHGTSTVAQFCLDTVNHFLFTGLLFH